MPTLFNYQKPVVPPDFLASPFPQLALTNILGKGGASLILSFPYRIVLKTPNKYHIMDDWSEKTATKASESQAQAEWCMQNEKAVYAKLAVRPHRNLLWALLIVDEGIFLPRMDSTLEAYTLSWSMGYSEVSAKTKNQWINQFTAGAAWLEALGFVHNDIRPSNIFIDQENNARLGDFGESGPPGQLHTPWLDQYGIGNCIWVLFHKRGSKDPGELPCDWEDPQTLDLPPLEHGPTSLIERCLRVQFPSLQHLHEAVLMELDPPPSTLSIAGVRKTISTFVSDILESINHWIAAQRCRRLYSSLRQDHGEWDISPGTILTSLTCLD
ncbi:MAG: hypothetical protein Q9199_005041 [Rusavskia elegans]